MSVEVQQGRAIFRTWAKEGGLTEVEQVFYSLEALFEMCLHQPGDQALVDRIIIEGTDHKGTPRRVLLNFQSVTDRDQQPPSAHDQR